MWAFFSNTLIELNKAKIFMSSFFCILWMILKQFDWFEIMLGAIDHSFLSFDIGFKGLNFFQVGNFGVNSSIEDVRIDQC